MEKQYGVKEAPVVLFANRTGRSFAQSNISGEHIVLYADGTVRSGTWENDSFVG